VGSTLTPTELLSEKAQQVSSNLERRDRVDEPARGYLTTEIPLDAGLVISGRAPSSAA
jgi:hypothetical protein